MSSGLSRQGNTFSVVPAIVVLKRAMPGGDRMMGLHKSELAFSDIGFGCPVVQSI